MRVVVGILSVVLIGLMLTEFFVTFLLPRRVKRDPRIARRFFAAVWKPSRALAARMAPVPADTMLGIVGPLSIPIVLGFLSVGIVVGFAGFDWAVHSHLGGRDVSDFWDDLYFSAGSFFSVSTALFPQAAGPKVLQVSEAVAGFAVLFIAIGYLPAFFQAFSRRETAVSQLDPRAGSPPTAGALLVRSGERGGWPELDAYLEEWENWAAELMETQLSYPALGYFRSQHVNQNWLAALTTVVDACAFSIAYAPSGQARAAELTYAIGRHALADLAYALRAPVAKTVRERLPRDDLAELVSRLEGSGLEVSDDADSRTRLDELRGSYEKYAIGISTQLALALPDWMPSEESIENWRLAYGHRRRDRRGSPLH
jgi:hypothetical protein